MQAFVFSHGTFFELKEKLRLALILGSSLISCLHWLLSCLYSVRNKGCKLIAWMSTLTPGPKMYIFLSLISRGLRFYQGLEKTVLKLEEKLKEFAANRKKKMDKIEEKEKEKKAKGGV